MTGWLDRWDYAAFKKEFKRLGNGGIYREEREDEKELGWAARLPYGARVMGGCRRAERISWGSERPTEELAALHADGWLFLDEDVMVERQEPAGDWRACWCCGAHKNLSGFDPDPHPRSPPHKRAMGQQEYWVPITFTCKTCQEAYRERRWLAKPSVKEEGRKAA